MRRVLNGISCQSPSTASQLLTADDSCLCCAESGLLRPGPGVRPPWVCGSVRVGPVQEQRAKGQRWPKNPRLFKRVATGMQNKGHWTTKTNGLINMFSLLGRCGHIFSADVFIDNFEWM
jgi:hypothetical protein